MDKSRLTTAPAVETPKPSTPLPKLRDSCVACASSKVKCHKQKPACSKCISRGITCEYVRSKRGGRNPAARSGTSSSTRSGAATSVSPVVARGSPQLPLSPVHWFDSLPTISDLSQAPATISVSSLSSGPMESSPSAEFAAMESDFGHYIAPASSSYFTENEKGMHLMGDLGGLNSFSMPFNDNDTPSLAETLPIHDEAGTSALFPSNPPSAVSSSSGHLFPSEFFSDTIQNNHDLEENLSQCRCSSWTIGLLKLFRTASAADLSQHPGNTTLAHHIQSIISRNRQATDRIDVILQCFYPHDSYLLVMLSMILMKVMDCYADAAQTKRLMGPEFAIGNENTSSTGSSGIKEHENNYTTGLGRSWEPSTPSPSANDRGRESYVSAAEGAYSARCLMHLLLGELHRPQRLVNQISGLLKAEEPKSSGHETSSPQLPNYSGLGTGSAGASPHPTYPFSDVLLRRLGLDLRRRLQRLLLEIRQALKSE